MAAGPTAIHRGRLRGAWDAIDERLGLSGLAYPVPAHANGIGYILGGIAVAPAAMANLPAEVAAPHRGVSGRVDRRDLRAR